MLLCVAGVMLRFVASVWGCRVSVMVGGLLAATGLSLGLVVNELYQVYLTFGLLTGEFIRLGLKRCEVVVILGEAVFEEQ